MPRRKYLRSIEDRWTIPLFPELDAARHPAPMPRLVGKGSKEVDSLLVKRQRRTTRWRGIPAQARKAPASVFDIAARPVLLGSMVGAINAKAGKYAAMVQPTKGVLRVEGAAYPARWTEDDYRKEAIRRAKQRPPRPIAKAKTKSEKLKKLI